MRDATIYIPTRGRVRSQRTWAALSDYWRARAFTVTDESEEGPLRDLGHHVLVAPMLGLAERRQWILDQHDTDLLGDVLIQMDDDLYFAMRRLDHPGRFRQLHHPRDPGDAAEFDLMMESLVEMSEYAPMGGISEKGGANRDLNPYKMNSRLFDVLMYDVPVARREGIQMDRGMLEDFDVALQWLTRGYPTLCLNTHWKGSPGPNHPGGCAIYRDDTWQNDATEQLAKLWPDFVTVVERPAWKGGGSETRTDVRVAWAQAFKAGCEGRDLLGIPQHPTISWATGSLEWS